MTSKSDRVVEAARQQLRIAALVAMAVVAIAANIIYSAPAMSNDGNAQVLAQVASDLRTGQPMMVKGR